MARTALVARLAYLSRIADRLNTMVTLGEVHNEQAALYKLNVVSQQIEACRSALEKLTGAE